MYVKWEGQVQRGDDWCLACQFDRRFCRALRGLRACWHPACAFGCPACWAAPGFRGCQCLACVADGHCRRAMRELRNCRLFARVLEGLACWAAPGFRGCWFAWLTVIVARQCGGCAAASLLTCSAVLLPGWLTHQPLACPLGARCWGMVCCVCLAALHRAYGGWASCLRQSILTSGFHVWEPMYRRGFRARRPRSCGLRTARRVARCAARCTGCFPAWKLFPR